MTDPLRNRIAEILEDLDGRCLDSAEERSIVADHLAATLSGTTPQGPLFDPDDEDEVHRSDGTADVRRVSGEEFVQGVQR